MKFVDKPEDFVVEEIISKKFLRQFSRTEKGVSRVEGPYTLYRLRKRNLTTPSALKIIARHFCIDVDSIGYAGLKDKFAVTIQYITIKNGGEGFAAGHMELENIGKTNRHISIGDLEGNSFVITLRKTGEGIARPVEKINKNGYPNYFGPQRFGRNNDNHIIGKSILKNNKDSRKFSKKRIKFFLHAYQSWIFNRSLENCIRRKIHTENLPIVGYDTKLGNSKTDRVVSSILKKEGISADDFRISELRLACRGSKRTAFVRPVVKYEKTGKQTRLFFNLPKGSYATTLLSCL